LDKEQKYAEEIIQGTPLVRGLDVVKEQNEQLSTKKSSAPTREQARDDLLTRKWQKAAAAYEQLIKLEGAEETLLSDFARALDGAGRYEQLLQVSETILSLAPNSAIGLAYKARALQKLERLSEATIANDQALLLDNNFPLAWVNRSGLQLLQQKFLGK
jgi:tetratricopeptide (TPR) repeat protein